MLEFLFQNRFQQFQLLLNLETFTSWDYSKPNLANNVSEFRVVSPKVIKFERFLTSGIGKELKQHMRVVKLPSDRKETSAVG